MAEDLVAAVLGVSQEQHLVGAPRLERAGRGEHRGLAVTGELHAAGDRLSRVGGEAERRKAHPRILGVDRGNSDVISEDEHEELAALSRAMIERVVSRL